MANGLFPHRSAPGEGAPDSPPIAEASPQAPPQQAALEPPQPPQAKTVLVTGSGFYVSTNGDLITNNHVIKGCDDAVVVKHGTARIVARDARNDLALLHLAMRPEPGTVRPVAFRSTPMQLGESVYVLGYPYSGLLDNGVNFTSGMVSSSAGMDNDSTRFQLTAPVQPGNSGIKGEIAASFLRANGIVPALAGDAPAAPATQVASSGSASTAQVVCSRAQD